MRSLLHEPPASVLAVATSPKPSAQMGSHDEVPEIRVPIRPFLGRVESTRAVRALGALDLVSLGRLAHRLTGLATGRAGPPTEAPATCIHAVPHTVDFAAVHRVAERLRLPLFLSLHDDPGYVLRGRAERSYALRRLGQAWRGACQRFVICEEMGLEMCHRYGDRPYVIVTDGLESVAPSPRPTIEGRLWVYFMGAANIPYADNFECLLRALARRRDEGVDVRLITRSGRFPFRMTGTGVPIESRPWASQSDILGDFEDADVVYMPLPFGSDHADLVRFSMSTKMVSYLGRGVPLFYHGPKASAAGNLLRQADAALVGDSLDVRAVADILASNADRKAAVAENALRLARRRFLLSDVRTRFWEPILDAKALAPAGA